IGGRVFTRHDSISNSPIELGAEFIHGRPPEVCQLLEQSDIHVSEVDGDNWCFSDGRLAPCDLFSEADSILSKMNESNPDESFLEFVDRCCGNGGSKQREAKERAISYVSG